MMTAQIQEAVAYIQNITSFKPQFGIILGTGLGALAKEVQIEMSIEYANIPHFPVSTVETHKGRLIFGHLGGKKVVVMQGRFHYYEGYTMKEVTFPVRVMKLLGIQKLFVSNAAGGLDPDFKLSDLMIINDHINLFYENPLTGKNLDEFGFRFPDMSEPYDHQMIKQAHEIAQREGFKLREGVYVGVPGPNLETKAEYRFLRVIGADAVGMSTVPEVIAARHSNLPVFAVSVITDLCSPGKVEKVTLETVVAAAMKAEPILTKLISELIKAQD
jgi:purine-nucleoside phosphorylase